MQSKKLDLSLVEQQYLEIKFERTSPGLDFSAFGTTKVASNVGNQASPSCVIQDFLVERTRLLEVN
jgi:hypothetical protein